MSAFLISDIHGCYKTFQAMLNHIGFSTSDKLYLLGDLIDRGPESKQVIDLIWSLQKEGHFIQCLLGNHEEMLFRAIDQALDFPFWKKYGGKETMKSFGVKKVSEIPSAYLSWLRGLPRIHELGDTILVHAGLDFKMANPFDNDSAMLWSRDWYDDINYQWLGDRKIIHGHTPQTITAIQKQLDNFDKDQVLNLDAGCAWTSRPHLGYLCCLNLSNHQLHFLKNQER